MNVLDQIFWKRFADEYKPNPANAGPACFAGMLQVGVIVFMILLAVFRLVTRLLTLLLAAAGADTAAQAWHPMEFRATLLLAAIVALYVIKRRYWDRRLQPEASLRGGDELNRGLVTLLVLVLMTAAAILMIMSFKVVRTYMVF